MNNLIRWIKKKLGPTPVRSIDEVLGELHNAKSFREVQRICQELINTQDKRTESQAEIVQNVVYEITRAWEEGNPHLEKKQQAPWNVSSNPTFGKAGFIREWPKQGHPVIILKGHNEATLAVLRERRNKLVFVEISRPHREVDAPFSWCYVDYEKLFKNSDLIK